MPGIKGTAAAYIRVSTEEQADLSPETQLEEIQKYARREGYILPDEYIFVDEGISGRKADKRPAFQKMIGTAKQKPAPFEAVLVWKFSRFARNQEESIVYKSLLRKSCGVEVISITETIPDGTFGSLVERVIEWFDEFYSIRLAQEVKRSMTVKAQRGELQSTPAFGYAAKDGMLVVVPEEAALVREMYSRYLEGEGCYPIARWLNSLGVTTHRGGAWENRTVEYILRNPVYIGKLRWTPTGRARRDFKNPDTIVADADHEHIIDGETWKAVQDKLDLQKARTPYKARPVTELSDWLSGVVRCATCGSTLVFQRSKQGHLFMKCNNYVRGRCTTSQHVGVELLHQAMIDRLTLDLAGSGDMEVTVVPAKPSEAAAYVRAEQALADVRRRMERLTDAYLAGVESLESYAAHKKQLEDRERELQKQISKAQAVPDQAAVIAALRKQIARTLEIIQSETATLAQKNTAIRDILDRCTFDKASGRLSVFYRVAM